MDRNIIHLTEEINELRDFLTGGELPLDNLESELYEMEEIVHVSRNKDELHKRYGQCKRIRDILFHAKSYLARASRRVEGCEEGLRDLRRKSIIPAKQHFSKTGEQLTQLADTLDRHYDRLANLDRKVNNIQRVITVKNPVRTIPYLVESQTADSEEFSVSCV